MSYTILFTNKSENGSEVCGTFATTTGTTCTINTGQMAIYHVDVSGTTGIIIASIGASTSLSIPFTTGGFTLTTTGTVSGTYHTIGQ